RLHLLRGAVPRGLLLRCPARPAHRRHHHHRLRVAGRRHRVQAPDAQVRLRQGMEMTVKPQRLHLSRKRGFDLQATSKALYGLPAKLVTRPGKWGNPFTIDDIAKRYGLDKAAAQAKAVDLCTQWLIGAIDPALSPGPAPARDSIRAELG